MPIRLHVALSLALLAGCADSGSGDDTNTGSGTETSTSGGDTTDDGGTGTADTSGSDDATSGAGTTGSASGSGSDADTGTGTEGAGTEGEPPRTCLEGKVGVFDVNTDLLYEDDPEFVIHSYPSNSPDDSPASTADFFAKVEADPSIDENFLFASGFSYGATMSLIHGYMSSDKLAGIIHLSQYSNPMHWEAHMYDAKRRIPVYIIHDDSYDGGGQHLRGVLLDAGYEDGVDLFYLDFKGGHSAPSPEEMETVLEWMKTMSLNGPCQEGG